MFKDDFEQLDGLNFEFKRELIFSEDFQDDLVEIFIMSEVVSCVVIIHVVQLAQQFQVILQVARQFAIIRAIVSLNESFQILEDEFWKFQEIHVVWTSGSSLTRFANELENQRRCPEIRVQTLCFIDMFELSKSDEIIEEQSSSVGIFETNGLDHGDEFLVDR